MSINSKARRDARRKQQTKTVTARPAPMPAHAHLLDAEGRVVGGIARSGSDWALVLGGQVITTTDSPAMAIAVLERAAIARGAPGSPLRTRCNDVLRDAAVAEAAESGQTLESYLAALEAERIEHLQKKQQPPNPDTTH
ncbi:hypothetical protein ACFFGH_08160 [Lysobacter korlensis]|uniref:Uncharacterized protein n=1 Tax=Lysobacter korlensis TaxID=553636 RepID=A0ABV6RLE5_9GAMM